MVTNAQSMSPSAFTGRKLAVASPSVIHGASSLIHSTKTPSPTPTAHSHSRASGKVCRASSPYSWRQAINMPPTTSTLRP